MGSDCPPAPSEFVALLNQLRLGQTPPHLIETFRGLGRKVEYSDGIEPTCLFPTRNQVLQENSRRLMSIKEESMIFRANDVSGTDPETKKAFHPDPVKLKGVLDTVRATCYLCLQRYRFSVLRTSEGSCRTHSWNSVWS